MRNDETPDKNLWRSLEEYKHEHLYTQVFNNSLEGSVFVANQIAEGIRNTQTLSRQYVLGLATGNSPLKIYEELIRLHRTEGLSFKNVVTFNLDEYYGLGPQDVQSYTYFMHSNFFDHIDTKSKNIHIPDGLLSRELLPEYCLRYEELIEKFGGLDFQLLGIGRTGHIGFNEPGSKHDSNTRMVNLDYLTRKDNAFAFDDPGEVPTKAITMGVGTILRARKIILVAWGSSKAEIVAQTVEGEVTYNVPASFLQHHKDVSFVIDKGAAELLTRIQTPWLVKDCSWTPELTRKAVVWLGLKLDKPILKLTDRDYNIHGMSTLASEKGVYQTNIDVFKYFQRTITGWPGGKPNEDDTNRPERAKPAKKRVIIFSPHPDDDVISMGGTFLRLVEQGHEVHVAYQTSGNTAVADYETLRFIEFAKDLAKELHAEHLAYDQLIKDISIGKSQEVTPKSIRKVRGLIRRGEALSACRYYNVPDSQIHFLDLPFYETGRSKKNAPTTADASIVRALIEDIQPHQIFAAGDLADPHGTHEVCLNIILSVLDDLKNQAFMDDCRLWLYRGAWHEYGLDEIEMAVPLSPDELYKKRMAIWRHQSQKDGVVYQGDDHREFWQRAEARNRAIAKKYDQLGLSEYEAMETFRRYYF